MGENIYILKGKIYTHVKKCNLALPILFINCPNGYTCDIISNNLMKYDTQGRFTLN